MEKIHCHNNNFEEKLKEVSSWNITHKQAKKIQQFFNDYSIGKITGKRGSSPEGNLLRNLYFLKVGLENLKSETLKGVEQFLEDLLKDKIKAYNQQTKKYDGKPYVLRSKKAILKILSVFLKWDGKDALCRPLELNITTKKNDFNILSEEEIIKLLENTEPLDKKFLLIVLASSGMRAEEFHNVRFSDITAPEGKDNFVKITIKNQYSKTQGRTINLYDKRASGIVKKYLSKRISEGIKPDEPVFPLTYQGTSKWLSRNGKKILNKSIHYHLFRHTSATNLASKMNRQQLCIYFGWKFSSPMPDLYIQRAGVNMDDVDNKFSSSQIEELEDKIEKQNKNIEKLWNDKQETGKALKDFGNQLLEMKKQIKK